LKKTARKQTSHVSDFCFIYVTKGLSLNNLYVEYKNVIPLNLKGIDRNISYIDMHPTHYKDTKSWVLKASMH